jgi:hypothetical protein
LRELSEEKRGSEGLEKRGTLGRRRAQGFKEGALAS